MELTHELSPSTVTATPNNGSTVVTISNASPAQATLLPTPQDVEDNINKLKKLRQNKRKLEEIRLEKEAQIQRPSQLLKDKDSQASTVNKRNAVHLTRKASAKELSKETAPIKVMEKKLFDEIIKQEKFLNEYLIQYQNHLTELLQKNLLKAGDAARQSIKEDLLAINSCIKQIITINIALSNNEINDNNESDSADVSSVPAQLTLAQSNKQSQAKFPLRLIEYSFDDLVRDYNDPARDNRSAVSKDILENLINKIINQFENNKAPRAAVIYAITSLANCDSKDINRKLFNNFLKRLRKSVLLDPHLVQALALLIRYANHAILKDEANTNNNQPAQTDVIAYSNVKCRAFITHDDLVEAIEIIFERLENIHKQTATLDKVHGLLIAITDILNAMVSLDVQKMKADFTLGCYKILKEIEDEGNLAVAYQKAYAIQALARLPDDKGFFIKYFAPVYDVVTGAISIVSTIKDFDLCELLENLEKFPDLMSGVTDQVKRDWKSPWYIFLRILENFLQKQGNNITTAQFERLLTFLASKEVQGFLHASKLTDNAKWFSYGLIKNLEPLLFESDVPIRLLTISLLRTIAHLGLEKVSQSASLWLPVCGSDTPVLTEIIWPDIPELQQTVLELFQERMKILTETNGNNSVNELIAQEQTLLQSSIVALNEQLKPKSNLPGIMNIFSGFNTRSITTNTNPVTAVTIATQVPSTNPINNNNAIPALENNIQVASANTLDMPTAIPPITESLPNRLLKRIQTYIRGAPANIKIPLAELAEEELVSLELIAEQKYILLLEAYKKISLTDYLLDLMWIQVEENLEDNQKIAEALNYYVPLAGFYNIEDLDKENQKPFDLYGEIKKFIDEDDENNNDMLLANNTSSNAEIQVEKPEDTKKENKEGNKEEEIKDINAYVENYIRDQEKIRIQEANSVDKEEEYDDKGESEASLVLIQGYAGSGKSLFGWHLVKNLWAKYVPSESRIPLYINLGQLRDPIHDCIEQTLKDYGFDDYIIQELRNEGRKFVVILDGYDDIRTFSNLYKTNKFYRWDVKVIITCRIGYLVGDYYHLFIPDEDNADAKNSIIELFIAPFTEQEIEHYLKNFLSGLDPVNESSPEERTAREKAIEKKAREIYEELTNLPGIEKLIKSPFILKILMDIWQELRGKKGIVYNRAMVYKIFLEQYYRNGKLKLSSSSAYKEKDTPLIDSFHNYGMRLAVTMFLHGKVAIPKKTKEYPLKDSNEKDIWHQFFEGHPLAAIARQGVPLLDNGKTLQFLHKSLQEYYIAAGLLHEIDEIAQQLAQQQKIDNGSWLNAKRIDQEYEVLDFLQEMIRNEQDKYKDRIEALFAIVQYSAKDADCARMAANAISLLVYMRISMSGRVLRGINIPDANLNGGIFDNADLEGANLTGAYLGAWWRNASLAEALLKNVTFGERPGLLHDAQPNHILFSDNSEWLLTASGSNIYLWEIATGHQYSSFNQEGNQGAVYSIQFTEDKKITAVIGTQLLWWDIDTAELILANAELLRNTSITCAIYGHAGAFLAVTDNQKLWIWKINRRDSIELKHEIEINRPIKNIQFSRSNERIFIVYENSQLELFDIQQTDLTPLHCSSKIPSGFSSEVIFNADGNLWTYQSNINYFILLNLVKSDEQVKLEGLSGKLTSIQFSLDGKNIVTGSDQGVVQYWDRLTRKCVITFTSYDKVINQILLSPDGKIIAALVANDRMVRLRETTFRAFHHYEATRHKTDIISLEFNTDNTLVKLKTCSSDNETIIWDIVTGQKLDQIAARPVNQNVFPQVVELQREVSCADYRAWLEEISTVRLASQRNTSQYTLNTQQSEKTPIGQINGLQFSPKGSLLAVIDKRAIWLWRTDTHDFLVKLGGYNSDIKILKFLDEDTLATGSHDGAVMLWHRPSAPELPIWRLQWTTHPILYVEGCNINKSKDVLELHRKLLDQQKAKGTPLLTAEGNKDFTQLHLAVANGDEDEVKRLLERGSELVELKTKEGKTALHLAAYYGHIKIAEILFNAGASYHAVDKKGRVPGYYAKQDGKTDILAFLPWQDRNLHPNWNFFHIAVFYKDEAMVKRLLNSCANNEKQRNELNEGDGQGNTPLHLATQKQYKEIVQSLITIADINVNSQNRLGQTTLHIAVQKQDIPVIQTLINCERVNVNICDSSDQGNSPLHLAIQKRDLTLVNMLLSVGANVGIPNKDVLTPLHMALEVGDYDIFHTILNAAVDFNFSCTNAKKMTVLHLAVLSNTKFSSEQQVKILNVLVKYITKFEEKRQPQEMPENTNSLIPVMLLTDHIGRTVFHYTAENDSENILDELLYNAEYVQKALSQPDSQGDTPLHIVVNSDKDHLGIISRFVSILGADTSKINIPNNAQKTMLHLAVEKKNIKTIELLLKHKANPLQADNQNNTPLDYALASKDESIIKPLLAKALPVMLEQMELKHDDYAFSSHLLEIVAEYGEIGNVVDLIHAGCNIDQHIFENSIIHNLMEVANARTVYRPSPNALGKLLKARLEVYDEQQIQESLGDFAVKIPNLLKYATTCTPDDIREEVIEKLLQVQISYWEKYPPNLNAIQENVRNLLSLAADYVKDNDNIIEKIYNFAKDNNIDSNVFNVLTGHPSLLKKLLKSQLNYLESVRGNEEPDIAKLLPLIKKYSENPKDDISKLLGLYYEWLQRRKHNPQLNFIITFDTEEKTLLQWIKSYGLSKYIVHRDAKIKADINKLIKLQIAYYHEEKIKDERGINDQDNKGDTLLHWAVEYVDDNVDNILNLLNLNADPLKENSSQKTPLHVYLNRNKIKENAIMLLLSKCQVSRFRGNWFDFLLAEVGRINESKIKLIILTRLITDLLDPSQQDRRQILDSSDKSKALLQHAIKSKDIFLIAQVFNVGIKLTVDDQDNGRLLLWAKDNNLLAELLNGWLEAQNKVSGDSSYTNPKVNNRLNTLPDTKSLLEWAAQCGEEPVIKLLTLQVNWLIKNSDASNNNSEVDSRANKARKTLLHWAIEFAQLDLVETLLIQLKANPNAQDIKGKTALHYAFENKLIWKDNWQKLEKLLIDKEADENISDEEGKLPKDRAPISEKMKDESSSRRNPHAEPTTTSYLKQI